MYNAIACCCRSSPSGFRLAMHELGRPESVSDPVHVMAIDCIAQPYLLVALRADVAKCAQSVQPSAPRQLH